MWVERTIHHILKKIGHYTNQFPINVSSTTFSIPVNERRKSLRLLSYPSLQRRGHIWNDVIYNSRNTRRKKNRMEEGGKEGRKKIISYILYNLSFWLHLFLVMGGRIQGLVLNKVSHFLLVKTSPWEDDKVNCSQSKPFLLPSWHLGARGAHLSL